MWLPCFAPTLLKGSQSQQRISCLQRVSTEAILVQGCSRWVEGWVKLNNRGWNCEMHRNYVSKAGQCSCSFFHTGALIILCQSSFRKNHHGVHNLWICGGPQSHWQWICCGQRSPNISPSQRICGICGQLAYANHNKQRSPNQPLWMLGSGAAMCTQTSPEQRSDWKSTRGRWSCPEQSLHSYYHRRSRISNIHEHQRKQ